jgi:hypothetical protein
VRRPGRAPHLAAAIVATALAATLASCSSAPATTPSLAPVSGTPAASQPALASPAVGVVLHVDSRGLGQVTDFTLLTGGREVLFTMGTLEDALDFPAAHLAEHVASSEPVRVYFRDVGPQLVVYRLEDASASPGPSGSPGSAGSAGSQSPAAS